MSSMQIFAVASTLVALASAAPQISDRIGDRSSLEASCKVDSDCAAGLCCSSYGFCGSGPSFCSDTTTTSSGVVPLSSTSPTVGSKFSTSSTVHGNNTGRDSYTMYTGDGTSGDKWPTESDWVRDFETMWKANEDLIASACQHDLPNNSEKETADVKSAILSVSNSSMVDSRFILAVMMQESNGCVRVNITDYGVSNPGLMKDHDGSANCNDNTTITVPCPSDTITQMIRQGVNGTASGLGLRQLLAQAPDANNQNERAAAVYQAARLYNSGAIASNGTLEAGLVNHCYSSDIANRLTGWVNSTTACHLATSK